MSTENTNTTSPELLGQLQALLGQVSATRNAEAVRSWAQPTQTSTPAEILGVSVPISVETPAGKIRVYLNFGAQAASSPEALMALLAQLSAAGLPLDAWQPKGSSGWGNQGNQDGGQGRGWGNNGGFSGGRGGFNRGRW